MANYPNLNISKEDYEAMKRVAKLFKLRSPSALVKVFMAPVRVLLGNKGEDNV